MKKVMNIKIVLYRGSNIKKNKLNKSSVLSQLSNHHAIIVNENRKYMESLVISLRMLTIQGIAFRRHFENESSLNRGNFLELMNVISCFDKVVKKRISGPKNATSIIQFKMK